MSSCCATIKALLASYVSDRSNKNDIKTYSDNAMTTHSAKRSLEALRIFSKRRANKMPIAGMRGSALRALMVQFKKAVNKNEPTTHDARNSESASRSCQ